MGLSSPLSPLSGPLYEKGWRTFGFAVGCLLVVVILLNTSCPCVRTCCVAARVEVVSAAYCCCVWLGSTVVIMLKYVLTAACVRRTAKVAAFYSARMSSEQRNYPVREQELLADVETMLRHRGLGLLGLPIIKVWNMYLPRRTCLVDKRTI